MRSTAGSTRKVTPFSRHSTRPLHLANSLPRSFTDSLAAFRSDVNFIAPTSWEDVLAYCHNSANPVGELVLRIEGSPTPDAIDASNDICTALQVTNFIQDVDIDAAMGRTYLPAPLPECIEFARETVCKGLSCSRSP